MGLLQASGPDAIRSFMNQSFNNARIDSFPATIDSIIIYGEDAVVIGTSDEKTTDTANQSNEAKMRYITEWIGQPNGQWLLKRFNTEALP
jgi:ketosteroid isomerase-like protein